MTTDKKSLGEDPFAQREAEKYENPVPSREFILAVLEEAGEPMSRHRLVQHFSMETEDDIEALRRRLRAMERDGQIIRNRKGDYGIIEKMDLIKGRVIGHPDGFGFLVPDEGGDDLFISAKYMRGLMHGDQALMRVTGIDHRGRREGAPVEVIERANHQLVGRYRQEHGLAFVKPNNKRISQDVLVPAEHRGGALDGQIVVVDIIEQPTWRSAPIGRVAEVMGDHMAPGMEIEIALRAHQIPDIWPDDVEHEIKGYSREVPEEAKVGREDLRSTPLVTIDGEDSRDFDDAVFVERQGKGWRMLVAIADVSYYVKPGTALDKEASERGNSVYFPGRVIPMLPEILSNGLCSLNPGVDRLCMVCEMLITPAGVVRKSRFFEGVMRSHARLTYTEVAAMLQFGDEQMRQNYQHLLPHLETAYELYKVLADRRGKRGAIDFETTETRIIFGDEKKIDRIVPVVRNDAHRLIEEFMIAANVAAAEYLEENAIPALYRVHQQPAEEKFNDLKEFLKELGLRMAARGQPEPRHYAKLLDEVRQRPDARMIQTVLLRSLKQAVYCPENDGHFGLAFDAYTHFTSPIRRYPDLLVHRALKHLVSTKPVDSFAYSTEKMAGLGEHCSMTERRADEATRDVLDWLKCEYLQSKVGEEYDGIITTVTGFGLFVELKDVFVEGLVHVTSLDNDYYHFDAVNHRLSGERSGKTFRLADPIRVKVVKVNLEDRRIDFDWVAAPGQRFESSPANKKSAKPKFKEKEKSGKNAGRGDKGRKKGRKRGR
ncbi:MAG: ribonuclease R [Gammaproteobacteria bacterium]|nr:ribonuclease R [Gammaproteobacteria bacterium]